MFGILISRLDVWISCRGEGQHFIVATAGLVAIYGLTLLFTCGMVLVGSRGRARLRRMPFLIPRAETIPARFMLYLHCVACRQLLRDQQAARCCAASLRAKWSVDSSSYSDGFVLLMRHNFMTHLQALQVLRWHVLCSVWHSHYVCSGALMLEQAKLSSQHEGIDACHDLQHLGPDHIHYVRIIQISSAS